MIRQRFPADRLFRIGAWAVAGVTASVAVLSNAAEPAGDSTATPEATTTQSPAAGAGAPALPDSGLTILRVAPTTRVVEPPAAERGTGLAVEPARPSTAAAAQPAPPPPLPAAPAPIQSAGS